MIFVMHFKDGRPPLRFNSRVFVNNDGWYVYVGANTPIIVKSAEIKSVEAVQEYK